MNFLPEDDLEFLNTKGLAFELKTEQLPDGNVRRGIVLPALTFDGNLQCNNNGQVTRCSSCDLMILILKGYPTTKLDSFYTSPRLRRLDGTDPQNATAEEKIFGHTWQFWSRHLADAEWRPGIDGLETYLQYVRGELRRA